MRIVIASDLSGHEAKDRLAQKLVSQGHQVTDAAPLVLSGRSGTASERTAARRASLPPGWTVEVKRDLECRCSRTNRCITAA